MSGKIPGLPQRQEPSEGNPQKYNFGVGTEFSLLSWVGILVAAVRTNFRLLLKEMSGDELNEEKLLGL